MLHTKTRDARTYQIGIAIFLTIILLIIIIQEAISFQNPRVSVLETTYGEYLKVKRFTCTEKIKNEIFAF